MLQDSPDLGNTALRSGLLLSGLYVTILSACEAIDKKETNMNAQKQDRRIRRTRKLLKDSLISLMSEKEFKNISVKDITEHADLNRGTFYLHYNDTYHLLQDIEEEVLHDFQEMIDSYGHPSEPHTLLPVMNPMIHYVAENTAICKILFENNVAADFMDRLHSLIHENGREIIKTMYPDAEEAMLEYFFEFITYGLTGMLKWWTDSGKQLPEEMLAEMCDKAVTGAALRLLHVNV